MIAPLTLGMVLIDMSGRFTEWMLAAISGFGHGHPAPRIAIDDAASDEIEHQYLEVEIVAASW